MARPARRRGNLPADATSFVGRRRELAELKRKLSSARLVSLVGPGGVGKTRLAIRAAAEVSRGFSGGAWLVELADVRDPALVGNAVMAAMDLRDQAAAPPSALLATYLQDKQLLLVVDNCEHLLEPAAQLVSDLIRVAPGLRVIATSREPLSAPGEHVMPVPPLELPVAHAERLDEVLHNEAVMLFLERADAASGKFELTAENQAAVADLCRRLDGLPLAIELAAVRTRVLSVQQILERLADRFALLSGGGRAALPRHQTLETAIDWSHDLLTPEERTVLRRLCVFAGRFTLEDAAAVCMSPDLLPAGALDLLSSLVDKSLVLKEEAGGGIGCYRLHETMREYAARKLGEAGENDDLEARCTEYYVTTCGALVLQARFRLPAWLAWMDLEIDNIRSVLRRCLVSSDSRNGISLATSLSWYWITRATTEGVRWLDQLLASGPGDPATLGWSWFARGFLAVLQGDTAAAVSPLQRAVTASRDSGNLVQLAHSYSMLSIAANMAGDRASALRTLAEAASIAGEIDDVPAKVGVLQAQSLNAIFEADFAALRASATEGARLSREVGDLYALHMMNLNLGTAALSFGELAESKARYEEALHIAYLIDDRIGQYYLLAGLALHAGVGGQAKVAAQLLGASETIRLGAGATVMPVLTPVLTQAEDVATAALGRSRYEAEFGAGKRLSRESAVGLALGETPADAPKSDGTDIGVLAKRETDVARLIADGLSNKQIGARLFISERTVDSHVRSILNKLGFNSRAQIARWIASVEHHETGRISGS
jgi:predicted ATPase/DNA-binding CsgD family transcriptional regulator